MLSIIVPVYNEEDNLNILFSAIEKSVENLKLEWELILVDDGSQDGSLQKIREIVKNNPQRVSAVVLRRNFGQTAAIAAGLDHARGEIVVLGDTLHVRIAEILGAEEEETQ